MPPLSPPEDQTVSRRLVVWPLLLGVGGLFVAALIALGGVLLMASNEADSIADERAAMQLEAALAAEIESLERQGMDWAWWDEGIEKFVLLPDLEYIHRVLGEHIVEVLHISAAFVITPDDRLYPAFLDGEELPPAAVEPWHDVLGPLVEATRGRSTPERPEAASDYAVVGDDLFLLTATAMSTEAGEPIAGWDRQAVLVFGRRLDARLFDRLAPILGLDNLALASEAADGSNVFAIRRADGSVPVRLEWRQSYPGKEIVVALLPGATAIALGMLTLVGLLSMRILMLIDDFRAERERREAELVAAERRAIAADQAKSLFLANTSHELRTPLNAVIGYAETLLLELFGPLNDRQREYLRCIEDGGKHLLAVLQDVLDMARIEARREELEESTFEAAQIVVRAFTLTEPLRQQQKIRLRLEDASDGQLLLADKRRVLQMLLNLLSNALSFSPPGSEVTVRLRLEAGGLLLEVLDEGPGLPEGDLEKVLQPFHRLSSGSGESRRESNGLGLPLTAMLMGLHGGRLGLTNLPARGLAAALCFPPERTVEPATPLLADSPATSAG